MNKSDCCNAEVKITGFVVFGEIAGDWQQISIKLNTYKEAEQITEDEELQYYDSFRILAEIIQEDTTNQD
jgi:hypothetical protein